MPDAGRRVTKNGNVAGRARRSRELSEGQQEDLIQAIPRNAAQWIVTSMQGQRPRFQCDQSHTLSVIG